MDQQTLLIVYVAVMLGAMYFLFIAPQRKQRRQMAEMLSKLSPGDEVVTAGGLYGSVRSIEEDVVIVEIARGVEVRVAKSAILTRSSMGEPEE